MKVGFFGVNEQQKKDYFINSFRALEISFLDQDLDDENIPTQNDFDIISVFVKSKITPKVIDAFPSLKMISVRATGFDNIDLNYAKSKNIVVSNVPSYGSHTVAEFTFGLILSISRKIPQAIEKVKKEVEFDHEGLKGFDLYGKTLGVIGTGKIGANVIKIAKGFGMIVQACDLFPDEKLQNELNFQYVSLGQLLRESDIVTIHVPANKETHHLINKDNIMTMKKGAVIINTARGDVIETEAIYQSISNNHLSGAGLDVLESETELGKDLTEEFEPKTMKNVLEDSQLIKNPNVIVTPHTAFYTTEADQAITQTTVGNIKAFLNHVPENIVNS